MKDERELHPFVVVDTLRKTILLYRDLPPPQFPDNVRHRLYYRLNLDRHPIS